MQYNVLACYASMDETYMPSNTLPSGLLCTPTCHTYQYPYAVKLYATFSCRLCLGLVESKSLQRL
jgi:hypothetical protein